MKSPLPTKIDIPADRDFRSIKTIKPPIDDPLSVWSIENLSAAVTIETLNTLDRIWYERNQIDMDKQHPYGNLTLNDRNRADILRWILWGMDIDLAIHKVRTELVYYLRLMATKKARAELKSRQIRGLKHGDRVVLIGQFGKRFKIGEQGTVQEVRPNYALVQFDSLPGIERGIQTNAVPYDLLDAAASAKDYYNAPTLKNRKHKYAKPKPISS